MRTFSSFAGRRSGFAVSCAAIVCAGAWLAGCAVDGARSDALGADELASEEQALIGGAPVAADFLRSTVGIQDDCTAAKVGARLFLTAAHCVSIGRPPHGMPPPEGFPQNDGLRDDYLPGAALQVFFGRGATDDENAVLTIAKTTIHPSWWVCPLCQAPNLSEGGAADIAVVEVVEDTPQVPEARVELGRIALGTAVIKVGWGCEERTNIDGSTLHLGRYKAADAQVIAASEIQLDNELISNEQVATVDASYVITAGHAQDERNASLCLGDSGGPLYLPDSADPRVVGVNSDYTFRNLQSPDDLGGVSWTDWHTRTSLDSLHGVGSWLIEQGVNTVGG